MPRSLCTHISSLLNLKPEVIQLSQLYSKIRLTCSQRYPPTEVTHLLKLHSLLNPIVCQPNTQAWTILQTTNALQQNKTSPSQSSSINALHIGSKQYEEIKTFLQVHNEGQQKGLIKCFKHMLCAGIKKKHQPTKKHKTKNQPQTTLSSIALWGTKTPKKPASKITGHLWRIISKVVLLHKKSMTSWKKQLLTPTCTSIQSTGEGHFFNNC